MQIRVEVIYTYVYTSTYIHVQISMHVVLDVHNMKKYLNIRWIRRRSNTFSGAGIDPSAQPDGRADPRYEHDRGRDPCVA